jgi:hypothetical protein
MNGTASAVISGNPNNSATGSPRAFFSFAAANPDAGVVHFRDFSPEKITEPEPTNNDPVRIHAMGALNGTSADFDDVLFTVSFASASSGPPVISSVSILPAKPHTNDTLTAAVIATDPDGDPITLTYVWKGNGVVKRMVTTPDTHDTFDLSVAGNGDPGQTVAVEVTPNDGTANGTMHSTSVTVS